MNQIVYRLWRRTTYVLIAAVLVVAAMFVAGVRIVTTPSVPTGLWWVHRAPLQRNVYVLACLPQPVALQGKAAGYLGDGFCPGHAAPVMKHVGAMEGDVVRVAPDGLYVNGTYIPRTRILRRDSRDRPIARHQHAGEYRVGPGTVWLVGDSHESWDSRYFGAIDATAILGVGTPLIVDESVSQ